jgi:hypothetical protein
MNKELTLGNLLAILIPVFIAILIWAKNVETRLTEHSIRIETVERTYGKVEAKLDNMAETLLNILIELQNKVDEKK